MGVRVVVVCGALAVGLGGCASQPQPEWSSTPVRDAGPAGERAARLAKVRADWAIENLANLDTPGFRATRVVGPDLTGDVLLTAADQRQGSPICTDFPLDLMLNGRGFFRLEGNDGFVYTRNGRFTRNGDGEIVLAIDPSLRLSPPITIPDATVSITIDNRGRVSCYEAGGKDEPMEIGQLTLVVFHAPERLRMTGVLLRETANSGPAIEVDFGDGCEVIQGFYEQSNVDPLQERIEIEKARRVMDLWGTGQAERVVVTR